MCEWLAVVTGNVHKSLASISNVSFKELIGILDG